ncbi:hypothetical protein GCM10010413_09520 [Promicromonospora sukumoe]|uniref:Uncharacterized protein n=1 Tax=Promicromonospora sukumoe TaxID=88382 RepID=A0A7W3PCK2_9MICO|nr:hypothetical protein [Promicromonospora sukumoe]MBA8806622.1 hypothetical protein [Promicromonospora sukumoe]
MTASADRQSVTHRVSSSGLELLEILPDSGALNGAWRRVIRGDVVPDLRVPDVDRASTLENLAARWLECMRRWGVADEGENFLIGLPGSPPEVALATMTGEVDLSPLGLCPGEPEFVASNLDRTVAVGVTAEEREFWIVRVDWDGAPASL